MIAQFGLPGEEKFRWAWYPRKSQAAAWVYGVCEAARAAGFPQGIPSTRTLPDSIANGVRWRDGRRVFSCPCGSGRFVGSCCRVIGSND